MSFNGTEESVELGSPYELYLFRYGQEMPDEIRFEFDALPTPPGVPEEKVTFAEFSPDGRVLVLGTDTQVIVYSRDGDNLNPVAILPQTIKPTCCSISHDGSHFAIGSVFEVDEEDDSPIPALRFYGIQYAGGSGLATGATILPGIPTQPNRPLDGGGQVHCVQYSTDGQHVVVGHDGFPYLTFYSRSGNIYSTFSALSENPPGPCISISYGASDICVVATANAAPIMYSRVGQSYDRAATVPMILESGETILSAAFSPNAENIVVCRSGAPYLTVVARDGNTLSSMVGPLGGGPTGPTRRATFDGVGEGFVITMDTAPYAMSYDIKGNAVIKTPEWTVVLNQAPTWIDSYDNLNLALGLTTFPFLVHVKRTVFIDDGSAGYFAYTNNERPVTKNIPGFGAITFEAVPIKRDAFKSNGKSEAANMNIRTASSTNLSAMFLPYPPPQTVGVVIYSAHHDDPDEQLMLIWTGKVLSAAHERNEFIMTCDNNIVSMGRLGLRRNYQYGCPFVLYGSLCRASKEDATVKAIVISTTGGLVLSSNWFGGRDPRDFAGGYISWRSKIGTEYRTINSVTSAGVISYVGPLRNIEIGTEVTVTLGCNHQRDHCKNLHNNINNFGGQPWIPLTNPVKYHPFW